MAKTSGSGKPFQPAAIPEDLIPAIDNAYALGSSAKRWATAAIVTATVTLLIASGAYVVDLDVEYLNATYLNASMDAQNYSITNLNTAEGENATFTYFYGNGSQLFDVNYTDTTISNCSVDASCSVITYDSELSYTTDTNASTECSGNQTLLGNGTCYSIDPFFDDTTIADTHASTECSGNETLLGNGTCYGIDPFFVDTTISDTNASTECSGTTTYLDGEANCDDISGVYVDVAGDTMTGVLNLTNTGLRIGNSEANSYVYFYEGGSTTGESIYWDDSGDQFAFTDNLNIGGNTITNFVVAANSISSTGDIHTTGSGDDLWLGNSTQASASFRAYANGSVNSVDLTVTNNVSATVGNFTDTYVTNKRCFESTCASYITRNSTGAVIIHAE